MNTTFYMNPNRALANLKPVYHSMRLMDDIDRVARELWYNWQPSLFDNTILPRMKMYEEKDQLVINTEIPGVTEKDLEVMVDGDAITIKAEKKEEVADDTTTHARERYFGKYVRTVSLPYHIKGEDISAVLKNGVLEVRIPKPEETKPKKIEVKAQLPEKTSKKRQSKSTKKSS